MSAPQIVSLLLLLIAAVGGVLAYFKYKPGQREQVDMNLAKGNLNVAQGTFVLVTTELEDQFKRMSAELREVRKHHAADMAALRREFEQYRADAEALLAQRVAETREARAGEVEAVRKADLYAGENAELRGRVEALEAEVKALKSGRS